MKPLINRLLDGRIVLLFFTISSALYFLMLLGTIPHLHKITNGIKILDMMPTGYDSDYVRKLMDALGETGRHYYQFRQLPIDFVFPLFFGISNCLIIAWFLKKLGRFDSKWFSVCYLPLVAGIFDYAENFSIISIFKNYPETPEKTVFFCNIFSVFKNTSTTLSICILLFILIAFLYRRMVKKN